MSRLHELASESSKSSELERELAECSDIDPVENNATPLITAVRYLLLNNVKVLISAGANLNARNEHDLTPLMIACSRGGKKGERIALLLIDSGADVLTIREADGMTAMNFASGDCSPNVLKKLVAAGCSIDGSPGAPMTPLMYAAMQGNIENIEFLLATGANRDAKRNTPNIALDGCTAAELAKEFGKLKAYKMLT